MIAMALKDELTKMVGPLPLGAWIAVVGGGLAYLYYTRSQQAASDSTDTSGDVVDDTSTDPGVGLGGVPAGYTYTGDDSEDDTTGTGSTATYADNNAWGQAATNYLISMGYDAASANAAISAFINEGSPTALQWLMISSAEAYLGAPPDTVTTQNNPPTTGTTTTTPPTGANVTRHAYVLDHKLKPYPTKMYITSTLHPRDKYGNGGKTLANKGAAVNIYSFGHIEGIQYGHGTSASTYSYYPWEYLSKTKPKS